MRRGDNIPGDYKGLSNDTRWLVGNTPAVPMTPAGYNKGNTLDVETINFTEQTRYRGEFLIPAPAESGSQKENPCINPTNPCPPWTFLQQ